MDVQLLIVSLIGAAAAGLLGIAIFTIFKEGIKAYEEKYIAETAAALDEMFLVFSPEQVLYLSLLGIVSLALVGYLWKGNVITAVAFAILGWYLPKIYIWWIKRKRLKKFEDQLVDGLETMSNSLKAGFSLVQAFEMLAKEMNPPIAQEFALMLREHRMGVHIEQALSNMGERVPSTNLDLVISSILTARSTGGNLTEIFTQIANTIREITRLEGKVNSLTSQGKLQGILIGLLPAGLAFMMFKLMPEDMKILIEDPLGWGIIGVIVMMEGIGGYFIWRITNIDI